MEDDKIKLPAGCMTSDTPYVANIEEKNGLLDKILSHKKILIIISLILIITCLVVIFYEKPKEITKSTPITEEDINEEDLSYLNVQETEKTSEEISQITTEVTTESVTQETTQEITTEISTQTITENISTEANYSNATTEVPYVEDSVQVGGIHVIYNLDNTWEQKRDDTSFSAIKKDNNKSVVLYVTDSYVSIGKLEQLKTVLKGTYNPYSSDTNMKLTDSKEFEEREICGKTCYVTYYTGTDANGNPSTSIGLMQDIGGNTYAYVTIKDTFGYKVDDLLNVLAIKIN